MSYYIGDVKLSSLEEIFVKDGLRKVPPVLKTFSPIPSILNINIWLLLISHTSDFLNVLMFRNSL